MPRWGRPPGAQLGRHTRRQVAPWMDDGARIEEIDSGDEYIMRDGRGVYPRHLAGMDMDGGSGLRKRMVEYDEYADEPGSVDGVDYDLYDDADSTVSYAVQLAMKDKEDWLVDKALERIRRAQMMGQQNVRLSKRELEALERKRAQASDLNGSERRKTPQKATSRPGLGRNRSSAAQQGKQSPPYPMNDSNGISNSWVRTPGSPSSKRPHSQRPRQSSTTPSSPLQSPFKPDRYATTPQIRSQASSPLKSPSTSRPLPDDPNWVPPYPTPYPRDSPPYPMHSPMDPRRGTSGNRTGLSPYIANYHSLYGERPSSARGSVASCQVPHGEEDEDEEDGEQSDSYDSGDELHIVDVVERKVPASPPTPRAAAAAASKGSRRRSRRS